MNIGKAIKKARNEKGISQLELGLSIDNDAAYISRVENNKKEPSISTFIKISHALEKNPVELFTEIFEK